MCIKQKEYNLTKTSLCKFVSKEQKKYKNYINSHQAQAEAEAVYKGVEKVLFEDGHHLHYRRYIVSIASNKNVQQQECVF